MNDEHIKKLKERFGDKLQKNVDVSRFTTIRSQSVAKYFFEAKTKQDLIDIAVFVKLHTIPYFIFGGGSNIIFASKHMCQLIIKNSYQEMWHEKEGEDTVFVTASSGYIMSRLVRDTVYAGLSGLQHQMGLPGTIGGAVAMNSKWTNPQSYIGDHVISATVVDQNGTIRKVSCTYFAFSYGYSSIQDTHDIVIDITFNLSKANKDELVQQMKQSLQYRNSTQPKGLPTSGCYFKNISNEEQKLYNLPTKSAGYLIDKAGLKGMQIGDFVVSDTHANFILNSNNGDPEDLHALITCIKDTIHKTFGVELKEEVEIVNGRCS